jgi:hypothetical protein
MRSLVQLTFVSGHGRTFVFASFMCINSWLMANLCGQLANLGFGGSHDRLLVIVEFLLRNEIKQSLASLL